LGPKSVRAVEGFLGFYNLYGWDIDNLDLYITHFHYDHVSLLPFIMRMPNISRKLGKVYIPGIPLEPRELHDAILYFIALADIVLERIRKDELLTKLVEIFGGKKLVPLYRGDWVSIDNNTGVRVVWPPRNVKKYVDPKVMERIISKLKKEFRRLTEELKKAGFKIEEGEIKELVDDLKKRYSKIVEFGNEGISNECIKSFLPLDTAHILRMIGKKERSLISQIYDALNDFSLILEYYFNNHPFIVIPGDNSDEILDTVKYIEKRSPSKRKISFLRGAHHGTHYGGYLSLFRAKVTWCQMRKGTTATNTGKIR